MAFSLSNTPFTLSGPTRRPKQRGPWVFDVKVHQRSWTGLTLNKSVLFWHSMRHMFIDGLMMEDPRFSDYLHCEATSSPCSGLTFGCWLNTDVEQQHMCCEHTGQDGGFVLTPSRCGLTVLSFRKPWNKQIQTITTLSFTPETSFIPVLLWQNITAVTGIYWKNMKSFQRHFRRLKIVI